MRMEPWGVEVKSGETQKVKPEFGKLIHISQAMIDISEDEPKNFKGPRLKIDDKYFTIGKKSTQIGLRLVLQKEFELSHNNKNGSVYFLGYIADDPVLGLDKPNSQIAKTDEKPADEDDYSSLDEQREEILTVDTEANSMNSKEDRYLYIFLGFDNLFYLNFDELCKRAKSSSEPKTDLKHLTIHRKKETTSSGFLFPLGMGLFFLDSKFHFFGGENLEYYEDGETTPFEVERFNVHRPCIGLPVNVRPKYGKKWYDGKCYSYMECEEEWYNRTVISFDLPRFTRVNSTLIPSHSSCKFRPFVFTISDKTYALSAGPISINLSTFLPDIYKLKYFEVYDHVKKEWRVLDNTPEGLCEQIELQTFRINGQCVFGKNMLLRTYRGGDYLFNSDLETWERVDNSYPEILAGIVIYNEYLLVLSGDYESFEDAMLPFKLVVYKLDDSFGKVNTIAAELDIYKNVVDFNDISIVGASFHLLDNNHINLVLVSMCDIHVLVLKVEMPFKYAVVKVHEVFDYPEELCCFNEYRLNSTFLL